MFRILKAIAAFIGKIIVAIFYEISNGRAVDSIEIKNRTPGSLEEGDGAGSSLGLGLFDEDVAKSVAQYQRTPDPYQPCIGYLYYGGDDLNKANKNP